jgi:transketolase
MFAAQHQLSNLTAIVDLNGLQALGATQSILNLNQAAIWSAFGWSVKQVDGHDLAALIGALGPPDDPEAVRPRVVIARTIAGYGVSFMENRVEWHYRNLTAEQASLALKELELDQ